MAMSHAKAPASAEPLPVLRPAEIEPQAPGQRWLVRELWGHRAVGVIGGHAKSSKTWYGLDLAISVASNTPCLGRFPVEQPGPVLVYLAEDALTAARERIEALCEHRGVDIRNLELFLIDTPALRIDLDSDRRRLDATLKIVHPRLLLLDPLVRMHRLDEDRAADISGLLGYLRELQRAFDLAVIVVHHAGKRSRAHPGLALRGSSDLYAWLDSAAYLARKDDRISLTLEHRNARAAGPYTLQLRSRSDGTGTHLELVGESPDASRAALTIAEQAREMLGHADGPMYRSELRANLRVNNQRLGQALEQLERNGLASRTPHGWVRVEEPARHQDELPNQEAFGFTNPGGDR